jgi:hypothetical protein
LAQPQTNTSSSEVKFFSNGYEAFQLSYVQSDTLC